MREESVHDYTRHGAALSVAVACALGACSGGSGGSDRADSIAASGSAMMMDSSAGQMTGLPSDTAAGATAAAGSMSEANIASMVAATNGAEIAAARMAERRGTSSGVKSFAQQMIDDHTAMQKSLDSLMKAKNVTPQSPPQAEQMNQQIKQTSDSLQSLSGAAFDRQYIASQVQMHQQALSDLQRFSGLTQDADLRALLDKSVSTVQQHLQKAQQLQ
jgi:putative membrane protein